MADEPIIKTKPDGDDTSAITLIKSLEVLSRSGGKRGVRIVADSGSLSGVDCLYFVAGGNGATVSSITSTDLKGGDVSGFPLAAGQELPLEFTAISLSEGTGYAIDRASP